MLQSFFQSRSTTVEITIGYLTIQNIHYDILIYNSRNYYRLLNKWRLLAVITIYNSRNYYRLLNSTDRRQWNIIYNSRNYYRLLNDGYYSETCRSTTVEITIGYLTKLQRYYEQQSTTVEITIGYLTDGYCDYTSKSTTVEITIGYLTQVMWQLQL